MQRGARHPTTPQPPAHSRGRALAGGPGRSFETLASPPRGGLPPGPRRATRHGGGRPASHEPAPRRARRSPPTPERATARCHPRAHQTASPHRARGQQHRRAHPRADTAVLVTEDPRQEGRLQRPGERRSTRPIQGPDALGDVPQHAAPRYRWTARSPLLTSTCRLHRRLSERVHPGEMESWPRPGPLAGRKPRGPILSPGRPYRGEGGGTPSRRSGVHAGSHA